MAKYVGSGGNCDDSFGGDAAADAWDCITVHATTLTGIEGSIALDESDTPFIAFRHDATGDEDTMVAHYVGGGGSCSNTEWECELITSGAVSDSSTPQLAVSPEGQVSVIYDSRDNVIGSGFGIAKYIGSGGNCADSAWSCELIWRISDSVEASNTQYGHSYNHNGDPIAMFTSTDGSTANRLVYAEFTGSGTENSCGSGASADWQCIDVLDWDLDGEATEIAVDSNGNPWATFTRSTNDGLWIARYVGSGGNCDTIGNAGSDAWQCEQIAATSVDDGSYTSPFASIAFDDSGDAWISFYDRTSNYDLRIAKTKAPPVWLSTDDNSGYNDRDGAFGDLKYHLSDGRSPRSDPAGLCKSAAAMTGICGLFESQSSFDNISAAAGETAIYAGAAAFNNNSELPTISFIGGSTDLSPSAAGEASDIYLQVYRFGAVNGWETVTSLTSGTCSHLSACNLNGNGDGTPSEYFELINGEYWTYFRVYQIGDTSTANQFYIDEFDATLTGQQLRGGSVFEDGVKKPFETD